MKKNVSIFLALFLSAVLLVGCGTSAAAPEAEKSRLRVVATIFPVYDWLREIVGDAPDVELTLLLDSGADLHSYQPTAEDVVKISTCDLFIYVGGESDEWVDDALAEATNKDMVVINLLEALGDRVKEEEIVEGMEDEEEEEGDGEEEPEYDEHVWLSLRHSALLCQVIADALAQLDPDHAEACQKNTAAYTEKLAALDAEYQSAVDASPVKTLLFGDRFPFRYMVDDYGLAYYAAFAGCSAETEASFETIVFLANKVDELDLHAICQIESADGSIARTIMENTRDRDQEILTFDSMQSTTSEDIAAGTSYLSIMEQNLDILKAALR